MKVINVGIIGFGTVGSNTVKALIEKRGLIKKIACVDIRIKRICDINLRRRRNVKIKSGLLTTDVNKILEDKDIDIVVELMGGIHPAKEFIIKAMKNGKHVVTANKALLAQDGMDVFNAANRFNRDIYFEASVGGGIPIIKGLREGFVANQIDTILGIVNGTSNYILSCMAQEGCSFNEALNEARKKGYAEKNPSLDINGVDSAHKLVVLTLLGFGKLVKLSDIYIEGILDISSSDIRYAQELGYMIKLLAIAKRTQRGRIEVRVHPTLLSKEHLLSNVHSVYNAIYVHGDMVGGTLFYGRGAGGPPASSAVVSDIVDVARNIKFNTIRRIQPFSIDKNIRGIERIGNIESRYYIRFSAIDKPGVLAKISGILGRFKISIATVAQKERKAARIVPIIMMTHEAKESNLRKALSIIDNFDSIRKKSVAIRVER